MPEGAIFEDPAFSLKGRREVGGMWHMLCDATKSKGREDCYEYGGQVNSNTARTYFAP
jgi:hypothetical protein